MIAKLRAISNNTLREQFGLQDPVDDIIERKLEAFANEQGDPAIRRNSTV